MGPCGRADLHRVLLGLDLVEEQRSSLVRWGAGLYTAIGINDTCRYEINVPGGWWPDVLPEH